VPDELMTATTRLLRAALLLAIVAVSASCIAGAGSATPSPAVCPDGISTEMGACDTRHVYTGSTCAELAREWVGVLNATAGPVVTGPPTVGDQARSVRLHLAMVTSAVGVNARIRELDLARECDVPGFMAVAEPLLSPELRSGAGQAMYDGDPVASFDDWLADLRKTLRVIDDGE
jgi:hypothetical protein